MYCSANESARKLSELKILLQNRAKSVNNSTTETIFSCWRAPRVMQRGPKEIGSPAETRSPIKHARANIILRSTLHLRFGAALTLSQIQVRLAVFVHYLSFRNFLPNEASLLRPGDPDMTMNDRQIADTGNAIR